MSSTAEPSENINDWFSAIGRFILNFGTLDSWVFAFLKNHLSSAEFLHIKEWHLKDRLNRMAGYLKDKGYPVEQQTNFSRLIERLESVRELRNHIAHGHLLVRFDKETKNPIATIFQAKDLDAELAPDSKHVTFAELQTALDTLTELIESFQQLSLEITPAPARRAD